jgi:uncharacterized protein YqjF (DUF2071 family)
MISARFRDLTLVTYVVPPALLAPRLPPGVELDLLDGQALVSLVALDVRDLRVLGVPAPWPGLRSFAEVNLRFYARASGRGGVVFVRELVESPLMALVARLGFGEPMDAAAIRSRARVVGGARRVDRTLLRAGARARVAVEVDEAARAPTDPASPFLTERAWGFGRDRADRRLETRMEHPPWDVHAIRRAEVAVDWARLYGPEWGFLAGATPASIVHARGSAVRLSGPVRAS